jgi:hypothetical protein
MSRRFEEQEERGLINASMTYSFCSDMTTPPPEYPRSKREVGNDVATVQFVKHFVPAALIKIVVD